MAADEDIKELIIEPIGIVHNFLDLEARLEIKIVADVASLKIEIDDANPALTRCLVGLELDGGLEHQRRIADATSAWDKRNGDGLGATRIACMFCIPAFALSREDVNNFLRIGVKGDPIGVAT